MRTPNVSKDFIYKLLSKKELWIKKHLEKLKLNPPIKINLEDEVLLFGEVYSIDHIEVSSLRISLERLKTPNQKNILKAYNDFYKRYAKEYLTQRVQYLSEFMNLNYEELKFRKMRSRWGSCSSKKIITLNTKLMKIDKQLIDYIIVHELAHLVHMNHSKQFHDLVKQYVPNSKNLDKELKTVNLPD